MLKSQVTVLDYLSHHGDKPAHLLHSGATPALCKPQKGLQPQQSSLQQGKFYTP